MQKQGTSTVAPLCVDLDGTLTRSDTLVEGIIALGLGLGFWQALFSLIWRGRAAFKQAVAANVHLDPALLPYHAGVLSLLHKEKARGRRLVLVTAANERVAGSVARHLGLFDDVIASDGTRNLKGLAKRDALQARFAATGFRYAGDSRSDLPVWKAASGAILVNASPSVATQARAYGNVERELDDRERVPRALFKAMRPHQWSKNLLVFIALLLAGATPDIASTLPALLAFLSFCATASGIYIINDLLDLKADRRHPRKKTRPFASGALSIQWGLAACLVLLTLGAALGMAAGILLIVAFYAVLSITYSMWLKEQPLVDVFLLACLYSVRLIGGGEATHHRVSLWLLAFSCFLFLSLALMKRAGELWSGSSRGLIAGRGYKAADLQIVQTFGVASGVASSVVLALFVQHDARPDTFGSPVLLWGIVPLVLFWHFRIWLSTARGYMHDDPIIYAARDWVSWLVVLATVLTVTMARVMPGNLL